MTPEQIAAKKAFNAKCAAACAPFLDHLGKCLQAGMAGDDCARQTHALFEAIPRRLRDKLAVEGTFSAMERLARVFPAQVSAMYDRARGDANYKRRLSDFWECLGDHLDVEDEEDADFTPGEQDDENEGEIRVGGKREKSRKFRDGGPVEEFEYPPEAGPAPKGDAPPDEPPADDAPDLQADTYEDEETEGDV